MTTLSPESLPESTSEIDQIGEYSFYFIIVIISIDLAYVAIIIYGAELFRLIINFNGYNFFKLFKLMSFFCNLLIVQ